MTVSVKYLGKRENLKMKGKTVNDLLKEMKVNPETVLVKRGKEIITEDEKIRENDEIELIRIISGG
ncbi:MAG: MoaD/ThiS family protein [Candidatus Aenigmarchaeota archaeon]|nr:MoaD/ThiS family protein [Candidatus Aenigmarchaeota archaeon]